MRFPAWYSIIVGILMFGQWGFFLVTGSVPEIKTEPVALVFHLAAEFLTAFCLIIGGAALLQKKSWARNLALFAAGMLAYTTVVSPGYFAQLRQWPLVGMFAVLLALDVVSVGILMRNRN